MTQTNSQSQFALMDVSHAESWRIVYHRFFCIQPDQTPDLDPPVEGFSVWDLYFLQDLFQAENDALGMVVDVGWYPHADPQGSYRLVVVPKVVAADQRSSHSPKVDWCNPLKELTTRSLGEIQQELQRWLVESRR